MNITYSGFDLSGKAVRGIIDSASTVDATEALRRKGIFATDLAPSGADARPSDVGPAPARGARAGKASDLVHFFRQLSILISTHTPLAEALEVLAKQSKNSPLGPVITDLRQQVEQGESLSQAMRAHPRIFDTVGCSMIAAGEAGGSLDQMLRALTNLVRQQHMMQRAIVGAMIYPVSLLSIGIIVLIIMITFVLPKFRSLFDTLHVPLPWTTSSLMFVGDVITSAWFIVVPVAACMIWGATVWFRSAAGQAALRQLIMATPHIGAMSASIATARIARLLSCMLEARINLVDALKLARDSTHSEHFITLLKNAETNIASGQSLAMAFNDAPFIPSAVSAAIASGERSGTLADVLSQIADYLDEDNQQVMKTISSVIEPIILSLLGVVIGGIAMSMFLPLFDLAGGGGAGDAP